jgi:hypothetical protein
LIVVVLTVAVQVLNQPQRNYSTLGIIISNPRAFFQNC